jgi:hypothetical protein
VPVVRHRRASRRRPGVRDQAAHAWRGDLRRESSRPVSQGGALAAGTCRTRFHHSDSATAAAISRPPRRRTRRRGRGARA